MAFKERLIAKLCKLADDIQREGDGESLAASQGLYGESAGLRRAAKLVEQEMADAEEWPCINCGLPTAVNPHPDAGKPSMMNWIGVVHVCVPCAEKRANGRRMLIARLDRWLEAREREVSESIGMTMTGGAMAGTFAEVRAKLQSLKEWFRLAYRGHRSPDFESIEEPKAYRWKSSGHIWRIVCRSRIAGCVIAERDDGQVATYAESCFQDPNVVEAIN